MLLHLSLEPFARFFYDMMQASLRLHGLTA